MSQPDQPTQPRYDIEAATDAFMAEMDDRRLTRHVDADILPEIRNDLVRSALLAAWEAGRAEGRKSCLRPATTRPTFQIDESEE